MRGGMADAGTSPRPPWWRRGPGAIAAAVAVVTGVLTFSDDVREKGGNLVCAIAKAAGAEETFFWCVTEPSESDLLKLLAFLQTRDKAGKLDDTEKAKLAAIEKEFEERAFAKLTAATGAKAPPTDAKTQEDTRAAIRETVEAGDTEEQRGLKLIADGNIQGGLALLEEQAAAASSDIAAKWRRIGRLAYGVDTVRARDAYVKVVALDRSDPWDAIYLARLHVTAGSLDAAARTLSEAGAQYPDSSERLEMALRHETGDIQVALGKLDAALESYRAALTIAERLVESDPSHAGWQRDLSVSHEKIGDIQQAQGNLDAALVSYRASLVIRERLAESDPSHAGWQRDLSVSHEKIGDIQQAQGNLDAALVSYRASLVIRERLAESDPSHAGWQRDLFVSLWKLAGYPKSDVRWIEVEKQLEHMESRGILHPPDRQYLEQARRRAAAER